MAAAAAQLALAFAVSKYQQLEVSHTLADGSTVLVFAPVRSSLSQSGDRLSSAILAAARNLVTAVKEKVMGNERTLVAIRQPSGEVLLVLLHTLGKVDVDKLSEIGHDLWKPWTYMDANFHNGMSLHCPKLTECQIIESESGRFVVTLGAPISEVKRHLPLPILPGGQVHFDLQVEQAEARAWLHEQVALKGKAGAK